MNKKIQQLRNNITEGSHDDGVTELCPHCVRIGFEAAWELHERLVAPLIEAMEIYKIEEEIWTALEKYRDEVGDE